MNTDSYDRDYYRDTIRCFLPSCLKYRRDFRNLAFLRVPTCLQANWCQAVERNCPKGSLYVCSEHFSLEEDCYKSRDGKLHLRKTASLVLTNTYYEKIDNDCLKNINGKLRLKHTANLRLTGTNYTKKLVRDKWLTLAGRDPSTLQEKSAVYFCEDHFDMPNDMENYMQYHLMGSVCKVRMKPGCMPTKFACQQNLHAHLGSGTTKIDRRKQPNIIVHKKRNMKENKECIKRLKENVTVEVEFEKNILGTTVNHNLGEDQEVSFKNNGKLNQPHMTRTKQSKANRTKLRFVNQVTSPLKQRLNSAPTSSFKKNLRVNSKTSKCRSEKGAPGPAGSSSAGTPLTEPDNLGNLIQDSSAGLEDPLATEPRNATPQCRFCAEYSKDCVEVTNKDRPYLTRNKTALTLNDLSVNVDFNDALPKTVCRACDSKLLVMFDFVKQVKEAQDSLINVREYVMEIETVVVKNECESPTPDKNYDDIDSTDDIVHSSTVTDTAFVKPSKPIIKNKRKRVRDTTTHKKPKVTEDVKIDQVEIIIDVKEETAEMVDIYETGNAELNDTETDTKPSELELQTLLKLMK